MKLFKKGYLVYIALAIIFTASYLLFSHQFLFWGDELFSINIAYKGIRSFLIDYFYAPDNHPILYYLLINVWQKIFFIKTNTDFLFRIPSIFFHFATILFIILNYCNNNRQKIWFFLLATVSSYFFMYSHMVRYYTLAAFITIVAYYFFIRWAKSKTSFYKLIFASILLMHIDYPSYFFFVSFIVVYYLVNKIMITKKEWIFVFTQMLSFLVVAYLIFRLYLVSGSEVIAKKIPITIAVIIKGILGLVFVPYHILAGEYFNIRLFPFLLIFLLIISFVFIWKVLQAKLNESLKDQLLFIIVQIVFATLFLTFITGRYPVFSYARFILSVGYFVLLILVQLFEEKHKYLLVMLILINLNSIYCNISQKDFINPIYFIPKSLINEQLETFQKKYPNSLFYYSGQDISDYFIRKYYPERSITELRENQVYIIFRAVKLNENYLSLIGKDDAKINQISVTFIDELGFDNINSKSKQILQRFGLMKVPYKYYIYAFTRK